MTKYSKLDDANGFSFVNDTGAAIAAGTRITRGGLLGITTRDIPIGHTGTAEFVNGTTSAWRVYLDAALLADVELGDSVTDPDTADFLGYAIFHDIGRRDANIGVNAAAADPAALAGETVLAFVGGGATAVELPAPAVAGTSQVFNDPGDVTAWPVATPEGPVTEVIVYVTPAVDTDFDVDSFLATKSVLDLPENYKVKFHNKGDGTVTKAADETGDPVTFAKNDFITVTLCGGEWLWA